MRALAPPQPLFRRHLQLRRRLRTPPASRSFAGWTRLGAATSLPSSQPQSTAAASPYSIPTLSGYSTRTLPLFTAAPGSRHVMSSSSSSSLSAAGKRLAGKTVLITGASSGIGRSTAREFARTCPSGGLRIILAARRVDELQTLAKEIATDVGNGVEVLPAQLDVSDPEAVRNFVPGLPEEWRDIHVLINNAGLVKGVARAPEIAEDDMNIMFETNVTGLINMTQAVLPIFLARPDGGQGDIVNIGSIAGREPYPGGAIYCATKAAVRSISETLRKELIATRIRVIEVDPGQVETNFSVVRFYGDKAKADAVYAGCEPLTPDDVAEVIVFAVSRRENVVVADTLLFPNHQASATIMHRKST